MKKIILTLAVGIAVGACRSEAGHNGTYVSHLRGPYSVADDTIVVEDNIIIKNTGYQKIRNGRLLPRRFKTRRWTMGSLNAPVIQFSDGKLVLGGTVYQKLP